MKYLLLALVLLAGCDRTPPNTPYSTPIGASNIQNQGNGWQTFDWQGHKILYHSFTYDRSRSEAFCELHDK